MSGSVALVDEYRIQPRHGRAEIKASKCNNFPGAPFYSKRSTRWSRPLGLVVASLHRKRLGARRLGRGRELRAEAFSMRRLEGSRWRLRRTLVMGIEGHFSAGKADHDPADQRQESGYGVLNRAQPNEESARTV